MSPSGASSPFSCSSVTPGLDHGDLVLGVDLADPVHAVERQQDPVGHRARPRPDSPVPLPRATTGTPCSLATRRTSATSPVEPGQHHRERDDGCDAERLVVGVVGVDGFARRGRCVSPTALRSCSRSSDM